MSGLKLVIPRSFTNQALPVLRDDPILPTQGAFMFLEPMHPLNPWAAGVPVTAQKMPNIVEAQAMAMMGTTVADDVRATAQNAFSSPSRGMAERTGKGGLHVIFSQTQNDTSEFGNDQYAFNFTLAQRAYLHAHYADNWYISLWSKLTRVSRANSQDTWYQEIASNVSPTGNRKLTLGTSGSSGSTGMVIGGQRKTVLTAAAGAAPRDAINNVASAGFTGVAPSGVSNVMSQPFHVGNGNNVNNYMTARGASASMILYRAYFENLTVSGRTYAEVDALDFADYTKQVVNPGGRYYGDTFTSPTTIP